MMIEQKPEPIGGLSSGTWLWIIFAVLASIVVFATVKAVATGARLPDSPSIAASAPPSSYSVTYRVTGSLGSSGIPGGSITYTNAGGDTEMRGKEVFDDANPWQKSFSAKSGAFLYVSVQNAHDYGSVKCEILLNGVVVKESSSNGPYVIASCSGRV